MVSWVTVIWSMVASACLTLAAVYALAWYRNRENRSHLWFVITAASTAGLAFAELSLMRADTPAAFLFALSWAHVPLFVLMVSIICFVRAYLEAGRLWLAWIICSTRAIVLVANLVQGQNLEFRNITTLHHIDFFGETITVLGGVPSAFTALAHLSSLLLLIFVADAGITAWRRGDHRKALVVAGSVEVFVAAALVTAAANFWADVEMPLLFSLYYIVLVAVMGHELSRDVLRASHLVRELRASEAGLRESEARLSLAVEASDFGIWIWDLSRHDIWASESWRTLHGFDATERLLFDDVLQRVHADDREGLRQSHAMAMDGVNGGRYEIEYRLALPDGTTRWISSRGRVERDTAARPLLIRGTSREVTAYKHAELAVRRLSGRLLSAQEEERRRIARELHDNLSQQIALLANEIQLVTLKPGAGAAVIRSMDALSHRTAEIATELHNLSHRLHSTKLEMLGLVSAVRGHCHELRTQGISAHFRDENVPQRLQHDVELCLFRIVQEALNNVVKHSGAVEAHVTLRANSHTLSLSVSDTGRGFDEAAAANQGGLGLASMCERLRLIDGELTIRTQPGGGTEIVACVPISRASSTPAAERTGVA